MLLSELTLYGNYVSLDVRNSLKHVHVFNWLKCFFSEYIKKSFKHLDIVSICFNFPFPTKCSLENVFVGNAFFFFFFLVIPVVSDLLSLLTETENRNIFLLALTSTGVKCHCNTNARSFLSPFSLSLRPWEISHLRALCFSAVTCRKGSDQPSSTLETLLVWDRDWYAWVFLSVPIYWDTTCIHIVTQHIFCTFVWYPFFFQLQGARILGIPVIITEQYPKGLGSTVQEIDLTGVKLVLPKTKFSMVLPEVEAALAEIPGVRSVVLFGVEVSTLLGLGHVWSCL